MDLIEAYDEYEGKLTDFSFDLVQDRNQSILIVTHVFNMFAKVKSDLLTWKEVRAYLYMHTRNLSIDYLKSLKDEKCN